MAHHAGYLMRIHWDQAHSAHGVGAVHPIGQYLVFTIIGQGVGDPTIVFMIVCLSIGQRLREPCVSCVANRPPWCLSDHCRCLSDGVCGRRHDMGVIMNLLRLSKLSAISIRQAPNILWADLRINIFVIITFVLITPFILWF